MISIKEIAALTEIYENFTSQDLDWDTINENMDDWVAKIELEIY